MYVYQEVLRRRNAASLAASEALKEASAAESIIRSLRYQIVSLKKIPLYLFALSVMFMGKFFDFDQEV